MAGGGKYKLGDFEFTFWQEPENGHIVHLRIRYQKGVMMGADSKKKARRFSGWMDNDDIVHVDLVWRVHDCSAY